MPYYNRFDIIEAHWWFCVDHHEGQFSPKYARMCKLECSPFYFQPGIHQIGPAPGNPQAIYDALCDKEGCEHFRLGDA